MKVMRNGTFVPVVDSKETVPTPSLTTIPTLDQVFTEHPSSDDFVGHTLNPRWTRGFKGAIVDVRDSVLSLRAANGSAKAVVLSQPAPNSNRYSVYAKMSAPSGQGFSDNRSCIFLGSSAIDKAVITGIALSGEPRVALAMEVNTYYDTTADWGDFGGSWSSNQEARYSGDFVWYRLTWNGTNVSCAYSTNGYRWRTFYTSATMASAPDAMGIVMYSNSGTIHPNDELNVDWFRVVDYAEVPDIKDPISVDWMSDGMNGLMNALGTRGLPEYVMPTLAGRVTVTPVSQRPNQEAWRVLDQSIASYTHSDNSPGQALTFDFGAGKKITPTRYGMAGRPDDTVHRPRQFRLEGSNNGSDWTTLQSHDGFGNDTGPGQGIWWSADVVGSSAYRYLRIYNWGNDSASANYLIVAEVEFWGTIVPEIPE